MKVFHRIRKQYAMLGISPSSNQSTQNYLINGKILSGFLLFGCLISSQLACILCVASGFMDYVVCICATSASIIYSVCFTAVVCRKTTMFECFDRMEELVNTSEPFLKIRSTFLMQLHFENLTKMNCMFSILGSRYPESKRFFSKASRQVERLSKNIFTVIMKIVLPCFMLPTCVVVLSIYFVSDSGSDSFELPYPKHIE